MKHANPWVAALRRTKWSLREWERQTGVSINTLRFISAGRIKKPQKRTRRAIVAALRKASADFAHMADSLPLD